MIKICLLVVGCGLFALSYMRDEPDPSSVYCDMVELYKSSNGENGWPSYRGEGECEK